MAVAVRLADRYGLIPPDHGGIYGVGETLTYAAQRILMSDYALAREFSRSDMAKAVSPSNELMEEGQYLAVLHIKPVKRSQRNPQWFDLD